MRPHGRRSNARTSTEARDLGEHVEAGFCGGGPDEGLGRRVVGADLAGDGTLQIGDGVEGAVAEGRLVTAEEKPSTASWREAEVGVNWNAQGR